MKVLGYQASAPRWDSAEGETLESFADFSFDRIAAAVRVHLWAYPDDLKVHVDLIDGQHVPDAVDRALKQWERDNQAKLFDWFDRVLKALYEEAEEDNCEQIAFWPGEWA